jgi:sulfhydrogenase subunit gamma (sulfur reductase)
MSSAANTYIPYLMRIEKIIDEAPATRTLRLKFLDAEQGNQFRFQAGQFAEYSIFGEGESTFCIASSPTRREYVECTFRQAGRVTTALAACEEGDIIGFRGPYGNIFPLAEWHGKNLLFIAGGIGMAPLRCVIWNALDLRDRFEKITIVYGARTAADLIYKTELKEWGSRQDVHLVTTVDPGGEDAEWKGEVGFVPHILKKSAPGAKDTVAIVCGPPIMIKLTIPILTDLGFPDEAIYTTLENRMKCGVGKCGHCMVGPVYVCKDGPVFTYTQMKNLPQEY